MLMANYTMQQYADFNSHAIWLQVYFYAFGVGWDGLRLFA